MEKQTEKISATPQENPVKKEGFTTKHAELWKFIKFSMASGGSTVVEFGIYYILALWLFKPLNSESVSFWLFEYEGKGYMYSFLISATIGYALAFILNRKLTFKADSNPTVSAIIYFVMVIFTIAATTWMGTALTAYFNAKGWATVANLIPKPIVAALATAWTYPINRFVIHRKKK